MTSRLRGRSELFLLVGPPGSGKRTVGLELARLTGAALLDNHLINDPIFAAFGADGVRPLPPEVWTYTRQVRDVVLSAVAHAPREVGHIFTMYLGRGEQEEAFVGRFRALAAARGAHFVPVWLDCGAEELARRMDRPERRERLKLRDPAALRRLLDEMGQQPAPAGALHLNTAELSPADAALLIASHSGALFRRG
ncbi:hypothetical protein [Deinococcus petrolearius]|uniref:Shikimate kinase n=1 Tax=Deinococcus petrolearius TaxID=1751295 RepID=A0ABW1DJS6_9DEIO